MSNSSINIVIGGEAGQGLVTVGTLLCKALVRHGYHIVVTQDYQSRIRGGHNTFRIRVSTDEIVAPTEKIDLLVALTDQTLGLHRSELSKQSIVISDQAYSCEANNCIKVPFKELAPKLVENIAALGVISALIGLNKDLIADLLQETFGKKGEEIVGQNLSALQKAYAWEASQKTSFKKLSSINNTKQRLLMHGNEAIVLGALSAGIKFYSFYPMTPSTSIGLGLAAKAVKMGLMVEQAEDEIAAINMAIGASYAGAPSMVATSGGGFALMVEGVSLAAMTETPIVVVVAQRPAPATGLPTRTQQADLEMVLHAGHGEFPRAIFTPGSVEECFNLTLKAFEMAERSQGPVFILTDQFLADSYRAIEPFDLSGLKPIRPADRALEIKEGREYKRYAFTEDGISPRLLPGLGKGLVVVDSDEHTEEGHLTEDLGTALKMINKRLKKNDAILKEVIAPDYRGDDQPDLLLVSWGSSKGAVAEYASSIRGSGKGVATLHFSQVWPLIPDQFMRYLEKARNVVAIEGNATAQFARLIRRETGFEIDKKVLRYDGMPMTPEFISTKLG